MKDIHSLHYLRFTSVTIIVLYHALMHIADKLPQISPSSDITLPGNFNLEALTIGVDVLFFASGFLITHLFSVGWTPASFLKNRAIRILPLYWLLTLLFLVLVALTREPSQVYKLQPDIIVRSILLLPQYTPSPDISAPFPVLYVSWFLSYELAFYATFAFSLWLFPRRPGLASASILYISYWCAYFLKNHHDSFFLFGLTGENVFSIIVGIMVAELTYRAPTQDISPKTLNPAGNEKTLTRHHNPPPRNDVTHKAPRTPSPIFTIVLTLLSLISLAWLSVQFLYAESLGHRFYDFGLPASILAATAINHEGILSKANIRLLMKRGSQACYSIYLIQVFTIPATTRFLNHIGISHPPYAFAPIYVVVTIAIGYIVHKTIEAPISRFLRQKFHSKTIS